MSNNKKRPVFLDLYRIHQPVTAVVSIGHRISGVLMVLLIPLLAYLFDRSLSSAEGYAATVGLFGSGVTRALLLLLTWVFAHHLLAGLRFLLMDAGFGVQARGSRTSAWVVLVGAVFILFVTVLVLV